MEQHSPQTQPCTKCPTCSQPLPIHRPLTWQRHIGEHDCDHCGHYMTRWITTNRFSWYRIQTQALCLHCVRRFRESERMIEGQKHIDRLAELADVERMVDQVLDNPDRMPPLR